LLQRAEDLFDDLQVVYCAEIIDELTLAPNDFAEPLAGKELSVFRVLLRHDKLSVALHYKPRRSALYPKNFEALLHWVRAAQRYFANFPAIETDSTTGARAALDVYVGENFVDFAAMHHVYLPSENAEELSLAVWAAFFLRVLYSIGEVHPSEIADSLLCAALLDLNVSFEGSERIWELIALEAQIVNFHLPLHTSRNLVLLQMFRLLRTPLTLSEALAEALQKRNYLTFEQHNECFTALFEMGVAHAAAALNAQSVPLPFVAWPLTQMRERVANALHNFPPQPWSALEIESKKLQPLTALMRRVHLEENQQLALWDNWSSVAAATFRAALLFLDAQNSLRVEELSTEIFSFGENAPSEVFLLIVTASDYTAQ
jgi:hypothetical protein